MKLTIRVETSLDVHRERIPIQRAELDVKLPDESQKLLAATIAEITNGLPYEQVTIGLVLNTGRDEVVPSKLKAEEARLLLTE